MLPVCSILIFCLTASSSPRTEAGATDPGSDLVRELANTAQRLAGVGATGAVLIAAGDEVVFEDAFGKADRENGIAMSADTVFTLGSITKSFTAVAILRLEMDGKLSVDDTLGDHFEGVPEDRRDVTLHQLLTHTGGMPDSLGDDWDLAGTRENLFAGAMRAPLVTRPGTTFHYSNVGYSLLGMIVEDVSGKPYETYLRETFFRPLGMERTGYLLPEYEEHELAVGYRGGERWGTVLFRPMLEDGPSWHLRANGGLHTTLADMQRWGKALLGDAVLSEAAKDKAFAAHVGTAGRGAYGYGFEVGEVEAGRRKVGHSGGNDIFSTYFRIYPEDGLTLVVTSTIAEISVWHLLDAFEGALLGKPIALPPATLAPGPDQLAELAGRYVTDEGAVLELSAAAPGLALEPGNPAAMVLVGGEAPSPHVDELVARTEDAIWRAAEGDYEALHRAYGVEAPLDEFAQRQREMEARMAEEFGEFVGVETVAATPAGSGADVVVRFDYTEDDLLLVMQWRGGAIGEIRQVDSVPRPRFRLFAMAAEPHATFEAHDFSRPVSMRVTFDGSGGIEFERSGSRVAARREP